MPRVFYRITHQPPTVENMKSAKDLGDPPPRSPSRLPLWDGVSVYATETQARNKARDFPGIGNYIATLQIPDDASWRIQRTIPNSRGHHTIWGATPAELLACVVSVVPV
jgi:hypothetical protein